MPDTVATEAPIHLTYAIDGKRPRLHVHPRAETISNFLRDYGVWQRELLAFAIGYLRPGDVFVDVGANIGYFSVYAGLRVGPQGVVHAIEPSEENAALLAANIAVNDLPNVRLHRVAVSDRNGEAPLFRSEFNAGAHSLVSKSELSPGPTVPVVRLDHLLQSERVPRLIKIDVQGADFDVLNGLSGLLRARNSNPAIIMEFCALDLVHRRQLDKFFGFASSHKYMLRAFIANPRESIVPPRLRWATLRQLAQDLVAANDPAEFDVLLTPRSS